MNENIPDHQKLIIEAPELQTLKQRYSSSLITLLFWVFWFYLWQPLISLVAWLLGFKIFYKQMIILGGFRGVLEMFSQYVAAVCGMAIIFFGWASYNNRRFKKKQRRKKTWGVSQYNLGREFRLTDDQVLHIKVSRRIVVRFDESGRISGLG